MRCRLLRPRRGRHGGRQQELDQDHRRGDRELRPGLLRVRLEEVRRDDHLAPALRPAADPLDLPDHQRQLRRLPPVHASSSATTCSSTPSRAPPSCSTARTAPDEVWDKLPARGPGADHREEAEVLRHRRLRGREGRPAWAGASTRSCRPASSRSPACCRATRRSSRSRTRSRRPTASAAKRRPEELRGGRRDARATCTRLRFPPAVTSDVEMPPPVPEQAPDFVQNVHGADDRRQGRRAAGQRLPGRRHLADRHDAVGEAQHRARDPGLGREALHPVRQVRRWSARTPSIRAKVYDARRQLAGAPATFKSVPTPSWKDMRRHEVHPPGRARGLHRLRALRRGLPGQEQDGPQAQGASTWRRSRRCASRSAPTGTSSWACPSSTARKLALNQVKDVAVSAAAVRVLRRLRRLRRDAVRQAADAALRRPRADRQRHRLLVDLRRQPADHALRVRTPTAAARPGPTRCSRTTPSSASACGWRVDKQTEYARELLERLAPQIGDELVQAIARRRPGDRGGHRTRSASAWSNCCKSSSPR